MRLAGLKRQAQRLARPKQMLLADDFVRRTWAKLLGKRGQLILLSCAGKQISQWSSEKSESKVKNRPENRTNFKVNLKQSGTAWRREWLMSGVLREQNPA